MQMYSVFEYALKNVVKTFNNVNLYNIIKYAK